MYQIPICNEELTLYGEPPITEAYAVIDTTNETLTFFRDEAGKHTNEQVIGDKIYFTGLESDNPTFDWNGYGYPDEYNRVLMTDTIKPITIQSWFSNLQLTAIDVSLFDTSECIEMSGAFLGIDSVGGSVITLDISNFDTSNVADMHNMFEGANVQTLDLSNFDTSNVTNMDEMFKNCTATTIYASNLFDTSNVTTSTGMFLGATNLVGGAGTAYSSSNPTDKTYAHIDGGASNPGYLTER